LWWAGVAAGRLTILHWLGCGCLLGILAMAKGPQPAGFFACGVLAHLLIERRWRDLPGYCLCMAMPVAATLAWGAIVYRAGDEATWLAYSRLRVDTGLFEYVAHNTGSIGRLALELLPATFMLPFVPWPWSRPAHGVVVPRIVAPMLLYSCACTAILFLWPGYNPRYAMPIAPSVAVLAGMGWDQLEKSGRSAIRRVVAAVLGLLIAFQIVLVAIVMPVFSDRFGETRSDGIRIGQAIRAAPAPAFCTGWDTNQLFYAGVQLQCLDPAGLASLPSPAWLIVPRDQLPEIARLRPDLDLRIALETNSGPKLTAVQVVEKAK
jgi:4-amino-4-deoxy-L-arabinose transferase-like glycosyltransferase